LRNPRSEDLAFDERPGWLSLKGSAVTLSDVDSPSLVGRRQEHFNCEVSTLLDFEPGVDGEEAGLAVLLNERFHYEIAVSRIEGGRRVLLRRTLGMLWKVEASNAAEGPVTLKVQAGHQAYRFSFIGADGREIRMGSGECGLLSTEAAGKFTGVLFALYATGNGRSCSTSAFFDWFDYSIAQEQWRLPEEGL
jgi:alpha-N-arabinofuranosidase